MRAGSGHNILQSHVVFFRYRKEGALLKRPGTGGTGNFRTYFYKMSGKGISRLPAYWPAVLNRGITILN